MILVAIKAAWAKLKNVRANDGISALSYYCPIFGGTNRVEFVYELKPIMAHNSFYKRQLRHKSLFYKNKQKGRD